MRSVLLSLMFILSATEVAVSQNFHWVSQAGGFLYDRGNAIAVDAAGNSYVTGYFMQTITFPGNTSLTTTGGMDIFVAKYSPNGALLWVTQAGGPSNDAGTAISLDVAGNIYVTGRIRGTVQFSSTQSVTSAGNDDIFVAKYNSGGVLQWVLSGGGASDDSGNGIAADPATGHFYVAGDFKGSATFKTTSGFPVSLASSGNSDIFVAYYNTNGRLQGVKGVGGSNSESATSISLNSTKSVYLTGTFGSTFTWGQTTLTPVGGSDGFVAKYNAVGGIVWVRAMVGPSSDGGSGISVDSFDGPYVVGYYRDSLAFSTSSINLSSPGNNQEIFIARYNSNGNLLGARSAGGPSDDFPAAIKVRGSLVCVTGSIQDTALFSSQALTVLGEDDIFVAVYSSAGSLIWVQKAGGTSSERGLGIAMDGQNRIYITGTYRSHPAAFPGTSGLTYAASWDMFVARIY